MDTRKNSWMHLEMISIHPWELLFYTLNLTSGATEETDTVSEEMEAYILEKIEERKAAKKEKNFEKADAIRNELLEKGIVLEDTREGVKWKRV